MKKIFHITPITVLAMFVWQQPLHADSSFKNQPIKYVVFAGGGGYRLWPLSSPEIGLKQFIPFLGSASLLKQTIQRLAPVTKSPQDVMVVTLERYRDDIVRDVGELMGTIVTEPMSRNTGPALLQALKNLSQNDQDPVIVVLWADHFIPQSGSISHVTRASG
jgi:mannose-1-phosphate guanylyltransferase